MCGKAATSGEHKVLKPPGSQHLVLVLRDIDIVNPDRYATVQLLAWVQQAITHGGFYDGALDFVTLQNVQIVATAAPANTPGRHALTPRFMGAVRVLAVAPPDDVSLGAILRARAESALTAADLPGAHSVADSVGTVVRALRAALPDSALEVTAGDAVQIVDASAAYERGESGEVTPAALAAATALQLRGRVACAEHLRAFDGALDASFKASGGAPGVFSTLGGAGACAAHWQLDDFGSLVRAPLWASLLAVMQWVPCPQAICSRASTSGHQRLRPPHTSRTAADSSRRASRWQTRRRATSGKSLRSVSTLLPPCCDFSRSATSRFRARPPRCSSPARLAAARGRLCSSLRTPATSTLRARRAPWATPRATSAPS